MQTAAVCERVIDGHPELEAMLRDCGVVGITVAMGRGDGSRVRVKANHTTTVLQLKQHIASLSAPGLAFSLRGGFPPKPLEDESLSLKDANLLNETIVQST